MTRKQTSIVQHPQVMQELNIRATYILSCLGIITETSDCLGRKTNSHLIFAEENRSLQVVIMGKNNLKEQDNMDFFFQNSCS